MLAPLNVGPADPFEYVSLADDALDLDAMRAPAHDPPRVWETPLRGATLWTLADEYAVLRDPALLRYREGERPTVFRLGRLTGSQCQAVADAAGDYERARIAVRYALRDASGYVRVERERAPLGEWATLATVDALPGWLIVELGAVVQARSGLTRPLDSRLLTRPSQP